MTHSEFSGYADRLHATLQGADWAAVERLAVTLQTCWREGRRVYLCGNGGSAANAVHAANDLLYGIGKGKLPGLRVQALSANTAVMTCLANDEGYDSIFALQLAADAQAGDVLIAFSGSGNSPNILRALDKARALDMTSFAVLGYSGGKAKGLADVPIHFAVDDMQVSEDLQMVVVHMLMQWLCRRGPDGT